MTFVIGLAAVVLVTIYLVSPSGSRPGSSRRFRVDEKPDAPKPFGYKMAWLAVRSEHPEEVAEALQLGVGMAANWNSGIGTVYDDTLGAAHVFVTPAVGGWTFVVGLGLPVPASDAFVDKLSPLLLSLGHRFPDVQYFFTYPLIDFFAWARVLDGNLVRAFAVNDEGVLWNKGKVRPEERAIGLSLFELRGVRDREGDAGGEIVLYPTEDHVLQVAKVWGLDPTRLDRVEGGGCGRLYRVPGAWCAQRQRKKAA